MSLNKNHDESQAKGALESSEERARQLLLEFDENIIPEGFVLDENGLWMNSKTNEKIWISSPIRVVAISRDVKNESFGKWVEFEDVDGIKHEINLPMELFSADGKELRGILMSLGLDISPDSTARRGLLNYLQQCKPKRRARSVCVTGWHDKEVFILPSVIIGSVIQEKMYFQASSGYSPNYEPKGSLEEWKQSISILCKGNSRLLFAMSLAFAPPLLHLFGEENGGVHFRGPSSIGKTTALYVAGSVWGGHPFLQRWRATTNGLEGMALAHNDTLLCLDEIAQIDPSELGGAAYMLANGQIKIRATKEGKAKRSLTWRLLFLSNGEVSLADHIAQSGKKIKAGQEVRVVDLPADTGKFGLFENLHGFADGEKFSDSLINSCSKFHGVASHVFLDFLVRDPSCIDFIHSSISAMLAHVPLVASGQETRVFKKFSLIAAAGELATFLGITGWELGEARDAALVCFDAWIKARGGYGLHEERVALSQIQKFFQENEKSRFALFEEEETARIVIKRAGFRRLTSLENGAKFYVFSEVFKSEICSGIDHSFAAKACIQKGWLIHESGGNPTRSERLPSGKDRVYVFSNKVLGDE